MAEGIPYVLGTLICYGITDLIFKYAASKNVEAHHFLAFQSIFFTLGVLGYGFAGATLHLDVGFAWGMVTGGLVFVALYNYARSLKSGAVSIVAPVFRLNFAVTVVLALFVLEEPLTGFKLAGLAASLAAVWLLLGGGAAGSARRLTLAAVLRVLIATLGMGIVNFIYKIAAIAGGTPATILAGQVAVYTPLTWLFSVLRDSGGFHPRPGAWRYSALATVVQVSGALLLVTALEYGQASVLAPIAQLGFVVTAVLGVIFLHEHLTRRKVLGLAFAIVALVCLALG